MPGHTFGASQDAQESSKEPNTTSKEQGVSKPADGSIPSKFK